MSVYESIIQGLNEAIDYENRSIAAKNVEAWEAGTNTPSGSAKRMLSLLKSDPKLPEKYNLLSR